MKDVRITSLPAYHDEVKGRRGGLNTIFVIEIGGLRLAQLSDIGHTLSVSTVEAMGRIEVLFVLVVENFSIDGRQVREIMTHLRPRVTIPIHYKTPATAKWPIEDKRAFVLGLKNVKRLNLHTVSLRPEALPSKPEIWVMRYRQKPMRLDGTARFREPAETGNSPSSPMGRSRWCGRRRAL